MRRSNTRRILRPIALDPSGGVPPGNDDLSTWSSSAAISTMALPGTQQDIYPLLVDVTNIIPSAARSDVGALRFRHQNGVTIGHVRTASNRILIGGNFHGGINTINVFWGKVGATQPGVGFPTPTEVVTPYRLVLIFENDAPVDLSPDPAPWTIVGTPTFTADGPLGKAMTCADGSYIETTAPKLRGNARDHRSALVIYSVKTDGEESRLICWANWLNSQRSFQLWTFTELEIYASANGTSFQRWRYPASSRSGWNSAGCRWQGGVSNALYLLNGVADQAGLGFSELGTVAQLHDSTDPYIIGGTKVPGAIHNDKINTVIELKTPFLSVNHMLALETAWANNAVFWGTPDVTPDNFDVPDVTGAPISTEVSFAAKQITGISSATPISVSGGGNPTYSIGSSFSSLTDIKAKGSTNGLISNGQWLASHHTSAAQNNTVQNSAITIGTATSNRRSTTVSASSGGSGIPEGPADVTVTSVSALVSAFNSATPGQVIELAAGNYMAQGKIRLFNKDFRGQNRVWLRASTRPFRGYMPTEGGLMVPGESNFVSGSGGAEVPGFELVNIHNVGFDGFRVYQGKPENTSWYASEMRSCTDVIFQYLKHCGYKPTTPESEWYPIIESPEWKVGRGFSVGVNGYCDKITFRKSIFHYHGGGLFLLACGNPIVEDCVFTDMKADGIRNDGAQINMIVRRCIFYRYFPQKNELGNIDHADHIQNTTKTQSGWKNHRIEFCVFSPGDALYPHTQVNFYECDNYPQYPMGDTVVFADCLIESRVANTIYARPANKTRVERVTILQQQYGGRTNYRDPLMHSPKITFNDRGLSQGNNSVHRTIYHGIDLIAGDTVTDSTYLPAGSYGTDLVNYPAYSSSQWNQVKIMNPYTGVLDLNELRKMGPKSSSALHPNNKGYHYGASQLLQNLGALA